MQELLWICELSVSLLPRFTNIAETNCGIDLQRRPFIWGKEQEAAFSEVKKRLTNPPVLHLPKADGRFILYSDTSKEGTGSSLWQIQEGKPKLLGYASKTLPEACMRHSATELEISQHESVEKFADTQRI